MSSLDYSWGCQGPCCVAPSGTPAPLATSWLGRWNCATVLGAADSRTPRCGVPAAVSGTRAGRPSAPTCSRRMAPMGCYTRELPSNFG